MRVISQERSFLNDGCYIAPYSNFIYGFNIYNDGVMYKDRNFIGNIIYGYDRVNRGGIYNFTIIEDKYNFKLHMGFNLYEELKKVEYIL